MLFVNNSCAKATMKVLVPEDNLFKYGIAYVPLDSSINYRLRENGDVEYLIDREWLSGEIGKTWTLDEIVEYFAEKKMFRHFTTLLQWFEPVQDGNKKKGEITNVRFLRNTWPNETFDVLMLSGNPFEYGNAYVPFNDSVNYRLNDSHEQLFCDILESFDDQEILEAQNIGFEPWDVRERFDESERDEVYNDFETFLECWEPIEEDSRYWTMRGCYPDWETLAKESREQTLIDLMFGKPTGYQSYYDEYRKRTDVELCIPDYNPTIGELFEFAKEHGCTAKSITDPAFNACETYLEWKSLHCKKVYN